VVIVDDDGNRMGVTYSENMAYCVYQRTIRAESGLDEQYQIREIFDASVQSIGILTSQRVQFFSEVL
jgi:hypothetical protein